MTRLIIATAALLMLALPASTGAANPGDRWLTYPTCTATTTTLTCTGRAVIGDPQPIFGLGEPQALMIGQVRFTCPDPVFDLFWPPLPYLGATSNQDDGTLSTFQNQRTLSTFQNGQTFTLQSERGQFYPSSVTASALCFGTYVQVDPSYYNVSVVVGWGIGSATPITALDAPIGTVSPP